MEPPTHSSVRETPRLGRLRRCGAGRGGGAAAGRVVGCWVARLKPLSRNELWTAARHVAGMLRESKPPATAGPSRRHPAAKNTPAAGIFGAPPRAAAAPGGLRNAAPGLPRAESRARPRAAARKSESYAIFVRRVRRFPERCRAAPRESVRLEQRRRKGRATRASTPLDEIQDAFGPYDRIPIPERLVARKRIDHFGSLAVPFGMFVPVEDVVGHVTGPDDGAGHDARDLPARTGQPEYSACQDALPLGALRWRAGRLVCLWIV